MVVKPSAEWIKYEKRWLRSLLFSSASWWWVALFPRKLWSVAWWWCGMKLWPNRMVELTETIKITIYFLSISTKVMVIWNEYPNLHYSSALSLYRRYDFINWFSSSIESNYQLLIKNWVHRGNSIILLYDTKYKVTWSTVINPQLPAHNLILNGTLIHCWVFVLIALLRANRVLINFLRVLW